MTIIEKDILTVETGYIFQQVNCQGVMGSGVAKAIRDKWPCVFDSYRETFERRTRPPFHPVGLLGHTNQVKVGDKLWVVNVFSQFDYNRVGKPATKHTEYGAFFNALSSREKLIRYGEEEIYGKLPVYFPYLIGCDRGGGDFSIISEIVKIHFPDAIFCKLPKKP